MMSRDTQSERAGFAVEGAGMAGQGPLLQGAGTHSLSAAFFAEGERKEAQGWDWVDLAEIVPSASASYRSFDEIPRRRLPWLAIALMAALVSTALCLL
jgi:hypothetical protein